MSDSSPRRSVLSRAVDRIRHRSPERFYLVSPAGVPNFGDEFIARSWLDWLTIHHPHAEVWLDCIEPGRSAHLFRDTHPHLRVTNTLWQLAHDRPIGDPVADSERARASVVDLGTPRIDIGLTALRQMSSIHLLGGGYMNGLWPLNLSILAAMVQVKESYGVAIHATGQGLLPQNASTLPLVRDLLARFDSVESRDEAGAEAFAISHGTDDAFLAFVNKRKIFADYECPDLMVLLQGDLVAPGTEAAMFDSLDGILGDRPGESVGMVEGLPPDDSYAWAAIEARSSSTIPFPFMRLWEEGFPAREGQTWVTTRFHFHLLAAAAGARGVALSVDEEYYDTKHALLVDAGTGWPVAAPGDELRPGRNPAFARDRVPELARSKQEIAREIYG